jgi:hypothetical protein
METCTNCERKIGNLERPYVWHETIVCHECFESLRKPLAGVATATEDPIDAELAKLAATPEAKLSAEPPARPRRRMPGPGELICTNPNCGFVGKPTRKGRGSAIVMIVLFLIAVLPGLIYVILMSGYDYFCPQCGAKLRTEHR